MFLWTIFLCNLLVCNERTGLFTSNICHSWFAFVNAVLVKAQTTLQMPQSRPDSLSFGTLSWVQILLFLVMSRQMVQRSRSYIENMMGQFMHWQPTPLSKSYVLFSSCSKIYVNYFKKKFPWSWITLHANIQIVLSIRNITQTSVNIW